MDTKTNISSLNITCPDQINFISPHIDIETYNSKDVFAWLKMFGIFLAALAALVVITLLTCKRPKSSQENCQGEVLRFCQPVYVVESEAPPCYQAIMEGEERDLPSYQEAVQCSVSRG